MNIPELHGSSGMFFVRLVDIGNKLYNIKRDLSTKDC